MRSKGNKGLLDVIAEKLNCVCLSDLRCFDDKTVFKACLDGIVPTEFSVEEWEEAVNYILRGNKSFSAEREAYEYLKKNL